MPRKIQNDELLNGYYKHIELMRTQQLYYTFKRLAGVEKTQLSLLGICSFDGRRSKFQNWSLSYYFERIWIWIDNVNCMDQNVP